MIVIPVGQKERFLAEFISAPSGAAMATLWVGGSGQVSEKPSSRPTGLGVYDANLGRFAGIEGQVVHLGFKRWSRRLVVISLPDQEPLRSGQPTEGFTSDFFQVGGDYHAELPQVS
jgi:hypothetical protein